MHAGWLPAQSRWLLHASAADIHELRITVWHAAIRRRLIIGVFFSLSLFRLYWDLGSQSSTVSGEALRFNRWRSWPCFPSRAVLGFWETNCLWLLINGWRLTYLDSRKAPPRISGRNVRRNNVSARTGMLVLLSPVAANFPARMYVQHPCSLPALPWARPCLEEGNITWLHQSPTPDPT